MFEIFTDVFNKRSLLLGDTIGFVIITISGFATHGEITNITRMFTTFIPLLISWIVIAPFFGLYNETIINQIKQLWRVIWVMFAVVPLAAWLRGLWLQTPIQPIFVLVLGGINIIVMLLWRVLYLAMNNLTERSYG